MNWNRRDWILLCAVTLLAALLRFYKLGEVPPGFQFDEAFNAIDAEQVWHGNRPLFLPANGGREALYTYYQALLGSILGFHVYSLRLASALAGIATIPATYWLLRTLLRRHSRAIAFFTSFSLAVSFWHLHFSHYGIRVIMMPLLLSALFGCFWLALHGHGRVIRGWALLGSGLLTGLTVWTHPSGRFVPFILIVYTGWLLWRYPSRRRLAWDSPLSVLVVMGMLAFLVFVPLGLEFYRHPDFFFGHASEVSIFAERVSGHTSPWLELLRNMGRVLGMFNVRGDVEWAHNLAGRPILEPLLAIPFWLGLALWFTRLWPRHTPDPDVDALALLAVWTSVMLLPSVLSEAAPNYSRTLPALPAVFTSLGLGLAWISRWPRRWSQPFVAHSGTVIAGVLLLGSGLWAGYDYFIRYPSRPESYYLYDADKLDALRILEDRAAQGYAVYLQPLWGDHATVAFLRSAAVKSLDPAHTLVLPPVGQSALYAFPGEKLEQAAELAELWPGVAVQEINDPYGKRLLALVRVEGEQITTWPPRYQSPPMAETMARFEDGPTLLGMQNDPISGEVVLFWQAEETTLRNLTAFLHLTDVDGRRVAQVDKLPGNGTYLTPVWSPGERVIEHYHPDANNPCGGGNPLNLLVGWYELAADGQRRPRLDGEGDSVAVGQVTLPIKAYPRAEIVPPTVLDLRPAPDLWLIGYENRTDILRPGERATFDLYWAGGAALQTTEVSLQLLVNGAAITLWQGLIAPATSSTPEEVICRRLHVELPAGLTAGNYPLDVATAQGSMNVDMVTVEAE